MPANVSLLTTRAECDTALASLRQELRTYQHRDFNQTYAEENVTLQAGSVASRLSKATADVAYYTAELTRAGISPADLVAAKRSLITATAQRDRLSLSAATATGPDAYVAALDADQVDAQIALLTAAIQAVEARKTALPA